MADQTVEDAVKAETRRCAQICDNQARVYRELNEKHKGWVAESCALMILATGKIGDPRLEMEFRPHGAKREEKPVEG